MQSSRPPLTWTGEFADPRQEAHFLATSGRHMRARARLAIMATSLTSLSFAPLDLMTLSGDKLRFFLSDRLLIAILFAVALASVARARTMRQLMVRTYLHQYAFFTLNALIFGHPVLHRHGGAMFPFIAIGLWICLPGSFRAMAALCAFAPAVSILFWGVARSPAEQPMDLAIILLLTVAAYLIGATVHIELGRMRREQHLHMERERRTNRALLEAKEKAEADARAKAEFLATVSHEIRTPLTGILVTLDLVERTGPTARQRPLLDTVRHSARILQATINDILDFSKIEAGKLTIENVPFDLRTLMGEAAEVLAEPALAKGLDLQLTINETLPGRIFGDPVRLRQVLINLLSNAVKFTDRGHVRLSADFSGPAMLCLRVEDTGVGIAPDQRQRLFEPFVQADSSTTRRYGGSGLGLAICHRLVTMMGGEIGIDGEPGKGSTFWFTLPLSATDEMPADGKPPAWSTAQPFAAPPHDEALAEQAVILLAEDNPVNQRVIGQTLDLLGYAVEIVPDGRQALERLRRPGIGLLITDAHMPEMDGRELTTHIRAGEAGSGRRLTVVGLSADAQPATRQLHLAAGMDEYVTKPFDMGAFAGLLDELLPQARPLRRPRSDGMAGEDGPSPAGTDGVLDHSVLAEQTAGNAANIRRTLDALLQLVPRLLDDLGAALDAEEWTAAFQAAHSLNGAARMVGAGELAACSGAIEIALHEGKTAQAVTASQELGWAWNRLRHEIAAARPDGETQTAWLVATPM